MFYCLISIEGVQKPRGFDKHVNKQPNNNSLTLSNSAADIPSGPSNHIYESLRINCFTLIMVNGINNFNFCFDQLNSLSIYIKTDLKVQKKVKILAILSGSF